MLAWAAYATDVSAFTHMQFGRFWPGMTPQEAMAAAPELDWRTAPARDQPKVVGGASAESAFDFAGGAWTVDVGDMFGVSSPSHPAVYDAYRFNMERTATVSGPEQCFSHVEALVQALEPTYGAFGQHPAFPHADNDLYGAPWGKFGLKAIGSKSRIRDYGLRDGVQDWTTFAEFDESTGEHAMVTATFIEEIPDCKLRIDIARSPERAVRASAARAKYIKP